MTRFKAIRSFLRRPGEVVMAGDLLELDDDEAMLLVSLACVLPVERRDQKRVIPGAPRITWEKAAEAEPLAQWRPPAGFARQQ